MAEQPEQPWRCSSIPSDSEVVEAINNLGTVVAICLVYWENRLEVFIDRRAESPFVIVIKALLDLGTAKKEFNSCFSSFL